MIAISRKTLLKCAFDELVISSSRDLRSGSPQDGHCGPRGTRCQCQGPLRAQGRVVLSSAIGLLHLARSTRIPRTAHFGNTCKCHRFGSSCTSSPLATPTKPVCFNQSTTKATRSRVKRLSGAAQCNSTCFTPCATHSPQSTSTITSYPQECRGDAFIGRDGRSQGSSSRTRDGANAKLGDTAHGNLNFAFSVNASATAVTLNRGETPSIGAFDFFVAQ